MDWQAQLQTAIYDRLSNYTPLTDACTVYDAVPQTETPTPYPYVNIGDDVLAENNTDDTLGVNILVTLHIWSDQPGQLQCKQIQGLIADALNRYDLSVTGYTLITAELQSASSFLDADGVTRHGQCTFLFQFE